ncbi:hypothetical protein H6P81_012636 [Aristolochia fimbriata]|uniref:Uncharacterized protein n=1 Tax=Aristolochia fimbriata TaxID=158543 RepID=A0AAV7EH02_ARIFI|nr:hypothetical protein H6P81_012636 [Aristolochia fimbriata]
MEPPEKVATEFTNAAETLLENKNYVGAWCLMSKASKLFPDNERVSELLILSGILSVTTNLKMKSYGIDWYDVVMVSPSYDIAKVKGHCLELKNCLELFADRFEEVGNALRLVNEASVVLSNRSKRTKFDLERNAGLQVSEKLTSSRENDETCSNSSDNDIAQASLGRRFSQRIAKRKLANAEGCKLSTQSEKVFMYLSSIKKRDVTAASKPLIQDEGSERPCPLNILVKSPSKRSYDSIGGQVDSLSSVVPKRFYSDVENLSKDEQEKQEKEYLAKTNNFVSALQHSKDLRPICSDDDLVLDQNRCLSPELRALRDQLFSAVPQNPHYYPLEVHGSEIREGMKLGLDIAFVLLSEKIRNVDPINFREGKDGFGNHLSELETMGYNVSKLRERLNSLDSIWKKEEVVLDTIASLQAEVKDEMAELDAATKKVNRLKTHITELSNEMNQTKDEMESTKSHINNCRSKIEETLTRATKKRRKAYKLESDFASVAQSQWL